MSATEGHPFDEMLYPAGSTGMLNTAPFRGVN
jgi:hypothetical protein